MKLAYTHESLMLVKVFEYGPEAMKVVYDEIETRNVIARDRSGAVDLEVKLQTINTLKETHKDKWVSQQETSWMMWATEVLKLRPTDQGRAIKDDPPLGICHLFRHPESSSDAIIRRIQQQCQVALQLIQSLEREQKESHERKMAILKRYHLLLDSFSRMMGVSLLNPITLDLEQLVGNVIDVEHEED